MRYFVVSDDGNKYGPADLATLNLWIQEGRLVSNTLLEEEASGSRVAAGSVAGLNFPSRPETVSAPGTGPVYTQAPGPSAQNPYSAGYANAYRGPASTNEGANEIVISWILGGLGLCCCCAPLPIVGIILALVAKNKGNPKALAPLVFNIIGLVISIVLMIVLLPSIKKGYDEGYQRAYQRQTGGTGFERPQTNP